MSTLLVQLLTKLPFMWRKCKFERMNKGRELKTQRILLELTLENEENYVRHPSSP